MYTKWPIDASYDGSCTPSARVKLNDWNRYINVTLAQKYYDSFFIAFIHLLCLVFGGSAYYMDALYDKLNRWSARVAQAYNLFLYDMYIYFKLCVSASTLDMIDRESISECFLYYIYSSSICLCKRIFWVLVLGFGWNIRGMEIFQK